VTPVEGLQLPYWTGMWLGIYPTWERIGAQAAAAVVVVGSCALIARVDGAAAAHADARAA
jgi:high-affinity iron transporter